MRIKAFDKNTIRDNPQLRLKYLDRIHRMSPDETIDSILADSINYDNPVHEVLVNSNGYGNIKEKLSELKFREIKSDPVNGCFYYAQVMDSGDDDYKDAGLKVKLNESNNLEFYFFNLTQLQSQTLMDKISQSYCRDFNALTPPPQVNQSVGLDDFLSQIRTIVREENLSNATNIDNLLVESVNQILSNLTGINYSVSRLYQSLESVISNMNVISESVLSRDLVLFPYYGTRGVFYYDDKLFIQEGSNFRFRLEMNQRERVHINDIQTNLEFSGARFDLLNYATINDNQVIINRDYNPGFNQIVELEFNPVQVMGTNFFGSSHQALLTLYVDGSIERQGEMRHFNPIRLNVNLVPVRSLEFTRIFNQLVERLGPLSRFPWAIIKPLFAL